MNIVLFEDHLAAQLAPITHCRPSCAIHCGGLRIVDIARQLDENVFGYVRDHLTDVRLGEFDLADATKLPLHESSLWVNARLAPTVRLIPFLRDLIDARQPAVYRLGNEVAVALLKAGHLSVTDIGSWSCGGDSSLGIGSTAVDWPLHDIGLLAYPHDVIAAHKAIFSENLHHRIECGHFREIQDGVFCASSTRVESSVVWDTRSGPVVIDHNAEIGGGSIFRGPVYVGPDAKVLEHSAIKHHTFLGATTKVGGEVDTSIIEAYSNKKHYGFLGHSYVGNWVNLGAGTSNSDLKNTYGEIRMEYGGEKIGTGSQFMGCVLGDYVKTAINTSIFTGKTVGVGSMLYGAVTTNVPSFVNYARSFDQVREIPLEVAITTQQRAFKRRGIEQRDCDIRLLKSLFEMTASERGLYVPPIGQGPLDL